MNFDSNNLTIPRGVLMFAAFLPGTTNPGAFVQLGNVPSLSFSGDLQSLPHYSAQSGLKLKDKEIPIARDLTATITTDDMGITNRMLWISGTKTTVTTAALASQSEVFADVNPGEILQLGRSNANPSGHRKVTVASIENGATTYAAGTDYMVDTELGLITILTTGAIPAATDLTVDYSVAASSRTRLASGELIVEGELKLVAFNPIGEDVDYTIPRVQLAGSGSLDLLQDPESTAFQTMTLEAKVLKKGSLSLVYADGRAVV